MTKQLEGVVVCAVLVAVLPAGAMARQQSPTCAAGEVAVTTLGIGGIGCANCTLFQAEDPRDARWEFGSEPVIETGIEGDDSSQRLRPGDVIVAIDGNLITTAEGGRRFARPVAGRAASLRIRRGGRELTVEVEPRAECRDVSPRSRNRGVSGRENRFSVDSVIVSRIRGVSVFPSGSGGPASRLLPDGWIGLSFQCSDCLVRLEGDSVRVWSFAEPPTIVSIESGSPAVRAGLRTGDRLLAIDGMSLTTQAGGERFGALAPGETVTLTYERSGRYGTTRLVTGSRAEIDGRSQGRARAEQYSVGSSYVTDTVRYTGQLGNTLIEVTGEPVTVVQTDDEIIIRSSTTTVRLKRSATGGR